MSKMNELYEKVAASADLRAEFTAIMNKATNDNAEEIQNELFAFAKRQGFEGTIEEMRSYFESQNESGELSDEDLDAVAGGKSGGGISRIICSVITARFACAVSSALNAISGDCAGSFK